MMYNFLYIHPLAASVYVGDTNSWVLWAFVILSLIAFGCSFLTPVWESNWENIRGQYDDNNMRRMLMFNYQPYLLVAYLALSIIVAAAIGAAILFVAGGVVYLLLWVVKLLIWALIIIGWIAFVGGAIFQNITGAILKKGKKIRPEKYLRALNNLLIVYIWD